MFSKSFYLLFVILISKVFATNLTDVESARKINVSVFYETQCPDCINFFQKQLLPVYKTLGDYFTVRFVPFGKATQTYNEDEDLWYFTCQHGNDECYYNMIHACALSLIEDRDTRLGFLCCLMTKRDESSVMKKCADMFDVDLDSVKDCVHDGKEGNHLLAGYGKETFHNFPKGLKFVPTITLNGVYDKETNKKVQYDFQSVICDYIKFQYKTTPSECC